jgi:hypothetical protein
VTEGPRKPYRAPHVRPLLPSEVLELERRYGRFLTDDERERLEGLTRRCREHVDAAAGGKGED